MKTQKEIDAAINTLKTQLDELPDNDIFGGSNLDDKTDMLEWINDLKSGNPYTSDEVRGFMDGSCSAINDFL